MTKIIKIERLNEKSVIKDLYPVAVTFKRRSKTWTLKLYPTRIGRSNANDDMLYHYYVDEFGRYIDKTYPDLSEQLNNFCYINPIEKPETKEKEVEG